MSETKLGNSKTANNDIIFKFTKATPAEKETTKGKKLTKPAVSEPEENLRKRKELPVKDNKKDDIPAPSKKLKEKEVKEATKDVKDGKDKEDKKDKKGKGKDKGKNAQDDGFFGIGNWW